MPSEIAVVRVGGEGEEGSGVEAKSVRMAVREALEKLHFKLSKAAEVLVKPNIATAKVGGGVTTHPAVLDGVLAFLSEKGFKNVYVAESSWKGCPTEKAFNAYKLREICKKYGYDAINLENTAYDVHKGIRIFRKVLESDFIINVPVLKEHRIAKVSLGMKNMKGCILDIEKVRFHISGLHEHIFRLNKTITPNLTIMDAILGLKGGPFSGKAFKVGLIFASYDVVALDSFACSLLGVPVEKVKHIRRAIEEGLGSQKYELV